MYPETAAIPSTGAGGVKIMDGDGPGAAMAVGQECCPSPARPEEARAGRHGSGRTAGSSQMVIKQERHSHTAVEGERQLR